MKTSQVLEAVGIPRHKLYYLEQKGYINPKRIPMGDLESREYSKADVRKIKLIWQFLKKGYKHRIAYEKAIEEINNLQIDIDFKTSGERRG